MRGLYIHIPFCLHKCPYCSFYSVTSNDIELIKKYLVACISDLKSIENRIFDTIYIGGGTPTAIPTDLLNRFIHDIIDNIDYKGVEFTIEVNPETVNKKLVQTLSNTPISRISMGVQSVDDKVLQKLGRVHSADKAKKAINELLSENYSLSIDMMYDIPEVPFEVMKKSALEIISFHPAHISAYSYTPDTGYLTDRSSEDPGQMQQISDLLEDNGYDKYEISNFAPPHNRAKHNMIYWQMGDYIGIGASAHSCINTPSGRIRYSKKADVKEYINNPQEYSEYDIIDSLTAFKEGVVFGLRMTDGIDLLAIANNMGKIPNEIENKIEILVKKGMLKWIKQDNRVRVATTPKGLLLLDSLQSYLW